MSDEAIWTDGRPLHRREPASRSDPMLEAVLQGQRGRRPAGDRRLAGAGHVPHLLVRITGAQANPRDRHARRLLDHLDGPRCCPRAAGSSPSNTTRSTPTVARANIARAGLGDVVEIRVGAALDACRTSRGRGGPSTSSSSTPTSPTIPATSTGRSSSAAPGTVIILDNVVRDGQVSSMPTSATPASRARAPPSTSSAPTRARRHRAPDGGCQGL